MTEIIKYVTISTLDGFEIYKGTVKGAERAEVNNRIWRIVDEYSDEYKSLQINIQEKI
jgi:hypothetical protein